MCIIFRAKDKFFQTEIKTTTIQPENKVIAKVKQRGQGKKGDQAQTHSHTTEDVYLLEKKTFSLLPH